MSARSILLEFARYADRGMLPNRFPDAGETPEYNTVDATLWFFEAIRQYVAHTERLRLAAPKALSRADRHHRLSHRRHALRNQGRSRRLAECGEPGVQLTWMDAKIGDWVVTPRYGKPVEIQALWFNALRTMQAWRLHSMTLANKKLYASLASRPAQLQRRFWNTEQDCLFDVVGRDGPDASIRPNQIFAVSLYYSMLDLETGRAGVEEVESELLTPFGLRTLAPSDPRYARIMAEMLTPATLRTIKVRCGRGCSGPSSKPTCACMTIPMKREAGPRSGSIHSASACLNLGSVKSARFVTRSLPTPRRLHRPGMERGPVARAFASLRPVAETLDGGREVMRSGEGMTDASIPIHFRCLPLTMGVDFLTSKRRNRCTTTRTLIRKVRVGERSGVEEVGSYMTCQEVQRELSNYLDAWTRPSLTQECRTISAPASDAPRFSRTSRDVVLALGDERLVDVPPGYSARLYRKLNAHWGARDWRRPQTSQRRFL